jgi:hypothetical protein
MEERTVEQYRSVEDVFMTELDQIKPKVFKDQPKTKELLWNVASID